MMKVRRLRRQFGYQASCVIRQSTFIIHHLSFINQHLSFIPMIAKDIKRGHIVNFNGAPCMIETINVQSPSARGASTFYKYRARNLISKQKVNITLRGGESLPEADFQKHPVKFMYADPTEVHLLDEATYEQYSLPRADLSDELHYLTERPRGRAGADLQRPVRRRSVAGRGGVEGRAMRSGHQGRVGHGADQARHAGDRLDRPGARVPQPRRADQGRYADGGVSFAGVEREEQ